MARYHNFTCPFQVGGSLQANSETYVTRKADEQLYKCLQGGYFSYVLSCRQVGKSSLRLQTMDRLEREGVKCVSIDLSLVGSHEITLEQWYSSFTYLLVSELGLYNCVSIRKWWSSHVHLLPHDRLKKFIDEIVLKLTKRKIVIFLDEIDSVKNVNFSLDKFFQIIGSVYAERVNNPDLLRLNFAVFGVATISGLMDEKYLNPFIKGRKIEIKEFKLAEIDPLIEQLSVFIYPNKNTLKPILQWTGGQPFLTQKVCWIIYHLALEGPLDKETHWLDKLIQKFMIINWQENDNPEHLKTISDRILYNSLPPLDLLQLYGTILEAGQIPFTDTAEEWELILSGLIVKKAGKLKVKNRLYQRVFNQQWLQNHLRRFQA
ncbi:MAG: AAA-like domain-containing protein [Chlorogloea purpurea SAG 13.99]|nr:AAA-like domain-containing protein [Chlorogloea purpurea SAG 13.99]